MKLVNREVGWDNGKPVMSKVELSDSEKDLVDDLKERAFTEMSEMTRMGSGDDQAYVDSALEQLHKQVNYSLLVTIVYKLLKRDCLLNTTEDERRLNMEKLSDKMHKEIHSCVDLIMQLQNERFERDENIKKELCNLFALEHAPCDNPKCVCQTERFKEYWKGAGIERRTTDKNEIIATWLESECIPYLQADNLFTLSGTPSEYKSAIERVINKVKLLATKLREKKED